jgi:hypothetical protein
LLYFTFFTVNDFRSLCLCFNRTGVCSPTSTAFVASMLNLCLYLVYGLFLSDVQEDGNAVHNVVSPIYALCPARLIIFPSSTGWIVLCVSSCYFLSQKSRCLLQHFLVRQPQSVLFL